MKIGSIITVAADEFLGTGKTLAEVVAVYNHTAEVRCADDGEICVVLLIPNSAGEYEVSFEPFAS